MRISRETQNRAVLVVVALAVGAAAFALARNDPFGHKGSGLAPVFSLDLKSLIRVDPAWIRYRETRGMAVPLDAVRAMAVGPGDRIHVAGDRAIFIAWPVEGTTATIPLDGEPTCLAVAGPGHEATGRIFVGVGDRVEAFSPGGESLGAWNTPGPNAHLTSIAVAARDLFVADAANRVVHRFDFEGKRLGTIGEPDPERDMPGFVVPSPFFDIAVEPTDGGELLHVANPGKLRIETFAFDGQLQSFWGEAGSDIDRFFGCCNPSQFAMTADGRFVTSEKGIPRVKIHDASGRLECVVAGPEQLGIAESEVGDPRADSGGQVFDVATDRAGRVLVLDPRSRRVRFFEPIAEAPDPKPKPRPEP
ncbi:MAG: hypothetical protein FJ297_05005 [Planctomycetes bacterium]|nr:hypothetical protein [Planctomycetota bacterium]